MRGTAIGYRRCPMICLVNLRQVVVLGAVSIFATLAHAQPASDQPPYGIPKSVSTEPQPDFGGEQRHGVMAGGELGVGSIFKADAYLGYMITPHVAALVAAGAVALGSDDCSNNATTLMVGARFWMDRLFVDARFGRAIQRVICEGDFDEPRTEEHHRHAAGQVGAGFDLAHYDHMGFEFQVNALIADNESRLTAGFGLTLYLP